MAASARRGLRGPAASVAAVRLDFDILLAKIADRPPPVSSDAALTGAAEKARARFGTLAIMADETSARESVGLGWIVQINSAMAICHLD